jgi:photosystem II stability/assembly factor-like uncharacterized protein
MAKAGLLFVGTTEGMVLFSNPNNIGRWLRIGQPLREHAIRAVWPLADNPLVVFAAVEGQSVQRSDDGGQSWRAVLDMDAVAIAGHPSAATIYALEAGGELYRSDDSGDTWAARPAADRPAAGGSLALAQDDARRLYLGAADGVWMSEDAGDTWARYGDQAPVAVTGLAAAPAQAGLYAIAGAGVYHCSGAGERWERLVSAPDAAGAPIVLAGKAPVLLVAQADGGIGRSDDGGATWTAASGEGAGGQIGVIAPASYHIDTAFAGSVDGVLSGSSDRGRTWEVVKRDLPPIRAVAAARLA